MTVTLLTVVDSLLNALSWKSA